MVALASGACQQPGELGFQPATRTVPSVAEIGPVALLQRGGSFVRPYETLRIMRLVSTLKPRHIVIQSQTCSTLAALCGTRLSPKTHTTVEIAQDWVLLITVPIFEIRHIALTCAVEAPCAV